MIKKYITIRFISLLSVFLLLFQCTAVPVVYALKEGNGEQTEGAVDESSEEMVDQATASATVNEEEETVEAPVQVENSNEANVENELEADAETGDEEIVGNAGDVDVTSENAEAIVDQVTDINDNLTEVGLVCESDCPCDLDCNFADNDFCDFDCGEGQCLCNLDSEFDVVVQSTNSAQVANDLSGEALSGGNEIVQNAGDATIDSGDAVAAGTLYNQVNTNETELVEELPCEGCEEKSGAGADVLVDNDNQAEAVNDVDLEATAGANLVERNAGDATVMSGNAITLANLLNLINTNLTGSNFQFNVADVLNDLTGDIDLLSAFLSLINGSGSEGEVDLGDIDLEDIDFGAADEGSLVVNNSNEGSLTNNVDLASHTGDNDVLSNAGDATILSGDALALANLLNFLNTNIVGVNWLVDITNIFGDFVGDIIVPGEGTGPAGSAATIGSLDLDVNNDNYVTAVDNNVTTKADVGDNIVEQNAGDIYVQNGPATADTLTLDEINTNRTGDNWVLLIINKVGSWLGAIIQGPESEEGYSDTQLVFEYSLDSECGECPESGCDEVFAPPYLEVNNDNTATLVNNVNLLAETGDNTVRSNAGDAAIISGAATALANVINFVNTNIVGGNWLLGMVNIFGDWNGDLVFAYPDLVVAVTDFRTTAGLGEQITYTISYANQGQMTAYDVYLHDIFPGEVAYIGDTSGIAFTSPTGYNHTWFLGDLGPGESGSFDVTVQVDPNLGLGTHNIDNPVLIETCTAESDPDNNNGSDLTTVEVYPDLTLEKDDGRSTVEPGESWVYTLKYQNEGNYAAEDVVIADTLPQYVSYLSASGASASFADGVVYLDLGTVAAGASGGVEIKVGLAEELPEGLITLENNAVISTTTEEPVASNNSAMDQTKTNAYADVRVTKSDGRDKADPEEELTYKITYENKGTIPAGDVVIEDRLPDYVSVTDISDGGYQDGRTVYWGIGRVEVGERGEVTLTVEIGDEFPRADIELVNEVIISTSTDEEDYANNYDEDTTDLDAQPELTISKRQLFDDPVQVGDTLDFKIVVENTGYSPAYEVDLDDILRDADGVEVYPQYWDLEMIDVGEEVLVDYTLALTNGVDEGRYTNTAQAFGEDSDGDPLESNEEQTTFQVGEGEVLGASVSGVGEVLAAASPITGDNSWKLYMAALSLILAGVLLRYAFKSSGSKVTKTEVKVTSALA